MDRDSLEALLERSAALHPPETLFDEAPRQALQERLHPHPLTSDSGDARSDPEITATPPKE